VNEYAALWEMLRNVSDHRVPLRPSLNPASVL
jgi:hypothetical protein